MNVEPLMPDAPPALAPPLGDLSAFARALDALGSTLTHADSAENAFAHDAGTLQAAVYARARADVALAVATAAAQRSAAAITSIVNMQV